MPNQQSVCTWRINPASLSMEKWLQIHTLFEVLDWNLKNNRLGLLCNDLNKKKVFISAGTGKQTIAVKARIED